MVSYFVVRYTSSNWNALIEKMISYQNLLAVDANMTCFDTKVKEIVYLYFRFLEYSSSICLEIVILWKKCISWYVETHHYFVIPFKNSLIIYAYKCTTMGLKWNKECNNLQFWRMLAIYKFLIFDANVYCVWTISLNCAFFIFSKNVWQWQWLTIQMTPFLHSHVIPYN